MRGHYACMPTFFGSLIPGRYHLRKNPKKKGSKQISTLSKALGNSKNAPKEWREKSLFYCLSCLTCTAHHQLCPSLLCLTCHMRFPHRLLLVYAFLRHTCFEPLAPTPPPHSGSFADPGCPESSNLEIYKNNKTLGVSKSNARQGVT
jgi:hypothetical protein